MSLAKLSVADEHELTRRYFEAAGADTGSSISLSTETELALDYQRLLIETLGSDCLKGMKIARRVGEQPALAPYRGEEIRPGPSCQSNDDWLEYVRNTGQTVYHPIGTCKMGADDRAVVDEQLRVHGIGGLRVIDASIMPTLVAGNTNAPTIMIAEKGAAMIAAANR